MEGKKNNQIQENDYPNQEKSYNTDTFNILTMPEKKAIWIAHAQIYVLRDEIIAFLKKNNFEAIELPVDDSGVQISGHNNVRNVFRLLKSHQTQIIEFTLSAEGEDATIITVSINFFEHYKKYICLAIVLLTIFPMASIIILPLIEVKYRLAYAISAFVSGSLSVIVMLNAGRKIKLEQIIYEDLSKRINISSAASLILPTLPMICYSFVFILLSLILAFKGIVIAFLVFFSILLLCTGIYYMNYAKFNFDKNRLEKKKNRAGTYDI